MNEKVREVFSRLKSSEISLILALAIQLVVAIVWAVHQEARITAAETAIANNVKRLEIYGAQFERIEDRSRSLVERIDRQETPLGRRVDVIDIRTVDLAAKVLVHDGRINELFNRR